MRIGKLGEAGFSRAYGVMGEDYVGDCIVTMTMGFRKLKRGNSAQVIIDFMQEVAHKMFRISGG